MLALVEITYWHWAGFIACVLVFLALDLGLFHRRAHVVKFREALAWTAVWFSVAMLFAAGLHPLRGPKESLEFLTGYLIELSLSMDNVFVIALIFAYFQIPGQYQHRVLFWGIVGALIMRGLMIGAGAVLISWLHWILYVLGAFVLFTGVKMLFVKTEVHPEKNRVVKWVRKVYPVTTQLDGQKFVTIWKGRKALTPLALVLVMVETTDLIFALDSIPAIFAVTTKPFIVFTSNVFAILGLRSLYFVLAGALDYFRYLKVGLSLVLVFIGIKMLLDPHGGHERWFQVEIPITVSLLVVGGIILISIILSLTVGRQKKSKA
ncbi:MAG TPA: TerC family protein [Candidatus Paceibacterota bacterium]|nr:TerC family protein [Verrucomicrobiota bacterium]HSA12702.1 TerC family protein [Candidatus Paceibacterota bacterium]